MEVLKGSGGEGHRNLQKQKKKKKGKEANREKKIYTVDSR